MIDMDTVRDVEQLLYDVSNVITGLRNRIDDRRYLHARTYMNHAIELAREAAFELARIQRDDFNTPKAKDGGA